MRLEDGKHWISDALEGTFNTAPSTGSAYSQVPTQKPFFLLPKLEKRSDAGKSGHTAPTHLCNHYWSPGQVGFGDDVETNTPARMFRRCLGGAVTDTLVEAGVYDHSFGILQPQIGSILPSFGVVSLMDAASYLLHGCMMERFKVSQKGDERAQYEGDIVNSGKFTNPHGLTSLPELVSPQCMDAYRTSVTYLDSDNTTTRDLTNLGKLIQWSVEHKNNIKTTKRRQGDPILTATSGGSGAYVRRMPRGKYETNIQLQLDFLDLSDWTKSTINEVMTNLKIKVVGPTIGSTSRHEFEIIVPKFSFEVVDPSDDDGDAATMINVIALEDPTTLGTITGRVRNTAATLV
jgi:hypothetical protein